MTIEFQRHLSSVFRLDCLSDYIIASKIRNHVRKGCYRRSKGIFMVITSSQQKLTDRTSLDSTPPAMTSPAGSATLREVCVCACRLLRGLACWSKKCAPKPSKIHTSTRLLKNSKGEVKLLTTRIFASKSSLYHHSCIIQPPCHNPIYRRSRKSQCS
jgi:hypothetical protein